MPMQMLTQQQMMMIVAGFLLVLRSIDQRESNSVINLSLFVLILSDNYLVYNPTAWLVAVSLADW